MVGLGGIDNSISLAMEKKELINVGRKMVMAKLGLIKNLCHTLMKFTYFSTYCTNAPTKVTTGNASLFRS